MQNQGELRAYFFNNMYLQGIHAGIQTQHCTAEMFLKYKGRLSDSPQDLENYFSLMGWAKNYKTTIVLNGGYASNLDRIANTFSDGENPYPWAYFKESEEALNGCITNVGIVVPKTVWGLHNYMEDHHISLGLAKQALELTDFQVRVAQEINRHRLMT